MSTAAELTMKVLYVKGPAAEVDDATIAQLRTVAAELDVTAVQGSADALVEIRRTGGWQALLVSPTLPQNETLALIASVRRDRVPMAIVPVVDEAHQDLFAAAIASGADDVLMRRGQTLVNVAETLARIRQSPHLFPVEQRRRIGVLYAGRDPLVWNLLEQVPFVKAEKVIIGIDGSCPVRAHGSGDGTLRTDAVVIDEQPGEAHPLQVLKSVKAQASDLAVIVLTSTNSGDIATAALELGADDTVLKTGIFRRRLVATLRRVHQRLELGAQQAETKAREERLRQIVENVPTGITVIASDGAVLAMNGAALKLFGAAKPRDVVGRDFRQLVAPADHAAVTDLLHRVTRGEAASADFEGHGLDGSLVALTIRGVVLERDAKGGRGVVASITRKGTDPNPVAEGASAAELASLQASLQRLERHYAELEDVRANERVAWEAERRRLESRLETAEKVVAERATLAARLDEVTAELARTSHTFAAERQTLEGRLQELEAAAREATSAGQAQAELQSALEAVRAELREAVEAHALERSGWQTIRQELEARVRDLDTALHTHADQAASLAALEEQIRQLNETLARERDQWNAARAHLEGELRNAREALWAEHNDRDTQRLGFDAELGRLRELLSNERVTWAATRSEIDAALTAARHDLDEARRAWSETEQSLRAELHDARQSLDTERQAWTTAREALETELSTSRSIASNEHAWTETQQRLEAELTEARALLSSERLTWSEREAQMTGDLERLDEARRAVADEYDATRTRLEAERDEARRELAQVQTDANDTRQLLEWERDDLRRELEQARVARETDRGELTAETNGLRAALDVVNQELADLRGREQNWQNDRSHLEWERDEARRLLDSERGTWESARQAHDGENHQLRDAIDHLNRELAEIRGREQGWHDTRSTLEWERDEARRLLDSERGTWESARQGLEGENRQLRDALDNLNRELDELRNREYSWNDTRNALESETGNLRAALDTLTRELTDVRGREQAWQQDRSQLEWERDDARRALDAERGQWNNQRSDLERERDDVRRQVEAERDSLRWQLEQERDDLRRQFEHASQEWNQARGQFEESVARVRDEANREIEDLRSGTSQIDELRMALDTARMEIDHLAAAHADDRTAWESARHALEEALRMATDTLAVERQAWSDERATLTNRTEETDRLMQDQRRLQEAINALRSDYASMVQTLEGERALRERHVRQVEVLQADIAEADRRHAALEQELEQTTVDAEALIRRRELEHQERLRQLEHDLAQGAARLARMAEDADRSRVALHAEYTRAAESHNRLVSSDLFGYAVTTLAGELVRCNDTFARLFGFSDAPDALTRTAGQLFPGLAGRTAILDRLTADGHVDRVESCLDRVDGRPIRVLESLTLLADATDGTDGETLVEHVMLGSVAGPTVAELQARRLEEVGALASAMVPEIEGLVSTLLERSNEQDHDRREIHALASQATALVRQLGAFSRRQVRAADPVELNQVVLRAEPMLMRLVGAYIGFSTDLKDTSSVTAAADDLDQLLSSLVTLGRDLLPAGGSILVETRQHADGGAADGAEGPMLVVTASGYGVQFPDRPTALEQVAERCNGRLRIAGEPGWQVRLEVTFPRCSGRTSAGWNWLNEN